MGSPILDIEKAELESLTYVKKLARTKCPAAIDKLVYLMENSEDEKIQMACANSILDRGLGKPPQDTNINATIQGKRLIIGD